MGMMRSTELPSVNQVSRFGSGPEAIRKLMHKLPASRRAAAPASLNLLPSYERGDRLIGLPGLRIPALWASWLPASFFLLDGCKSFKSCTALLTQVGINWHTHRSFQHIRYLECIKTEKTSDCRIS
jgi:hypothetical protein